MERPIKFRAWDKKNKTMIVIFDNTKQTEWFLPNVSNNFDVMQFTGLKDINHNEIYEKDILKICNHVFTVQYEIGGFMLVRTTDKTDMYDLFKDCWNDDVYPLTQFHWNVDAEEDLLANCEVIGNVYENSELMEG